MTQRIYWTWLAPAVVVLAAFLLKADSLVALGIGLASGLSLSGSI
jgi:hypothetical protein